VSRLDSFIRRLQAQRACLDHAAELITGLDGVVLELGLGNGRTYDHLRELFPNRDVFVCERRVAAHPDCIPPADRLLLGDMFETLPAARETLGRRVALAHFDAGTGDAAANRDLAAGLRPLIVPLLRADGVLATQQPMDCPELTPLPLPDSVPEGRYHLYRRVITNVDELPWRDMALQMFPELQDRIEDAENPYALWNDLIMPFEDAYEREPPDTSLIARVYKYARWCEDQPRAATAEDDLLTCIAVCFFEHIPKTPGARKDMPNWFSWEEFAANRRAFHYLVNDEEFAELEEIFAQHYPEEARKGRQR
jgi:S-adenosylmethionine-dependent methyltransferase